ncbi:MAG: alkaline phosphatase D family protein [Ottowia sp.]|nr:alkaline phosphatase D family protein [Ottowia sp.]
MQEAASKLSAFVSLGDWFYCDRTDTVNGVALARIDGGTLANAKSLTVRRNYHRAAGLTRGRVELQRNVPTYLVKDDHEYDPDNASYSPAWLDNQFAASSPHSAQDLTDVWTAAATAWREWAQGNPASEVSSGILGGPDCYRMRIGPLEVWCTDLIHERDYTGTVDGPSKRMMSALQEEWLLNTMAASSAPFKLWVCSKQFISSCGRNSDGFTDLGGSGRGYRTQLARILADARFPRAGCLSVTGDEHLRSDMMVSAGQFGGSHAAISQISAGPATIPVITDPNDGLAYRAGVRDKERDISSADRRGENNYVLLRVLGDRVERYVLGSRYGLRFMGYLGASDNVIRR